MMSIDKIVTDKEILKTISRDILPEELDAYDLINRMRATLNATGGVGLAAIQIGMPFRVCIVQWGGKEHVIINPTDIVLSGNKKKREEACLSIPNFSKKIYRSQSISYSETADKKMKFTVGKRATGMLARIIQHEFDHFEGKLIDG